MSKYYVIKLCCSDCKKFMGISVEYSEDIDFLIDTLSEDYYYLIFDSDFNFINEKKEN